MTATLIDAIFSFNGRMNRRSWWIGSLAVAVSAIIGFALFNTESFDESANAVRGAPTMAAFLWVALAAYAASALTAKRLADAARPRWLAWIFGIAIAALVAGWGAGAFLEPLSPQPASIGLWLLILALLPALVEAARRPSADLPHT